jgi:hypothetical protein
VANPAAAVDCPGGSQTPETIGSGADAHVVPTARTSRDHRAG